LVKKTVTNYESILDFHFAQAPPAALDDARIIMRDFPE
jgi:hypothetical protein